jgi:hypothetical protein
LLLFLEKKALPCFLWFNLQGSWYKLRETGASTARKHFFSKEEAKMPAHLAYVAGRRQCLIKSFFGSFSQKRTACFLLSAASTAVFSARPSCGSRPPFQ